MADQATVVPQWLSPVAHLTNNWVSRIGVALVTSATVLFLFLLPSTVHSDVQHPYLGILSFLIIPSIFFLGLALIPVGMLLLVRQERRLGVFPETFREITARPGEIKRLLIFVTVMTLVNIVIGSVLTYRAVNYMDSVSFCGKACHSVMDPEFAAYQNSPHSRVECVACHIGPGASWFVQSKLSGLGQVFAVTFDTYPRPIPTPVRNLRPARETCEACHWPQKFGADRLRILTHYADDEANTLTKTVLLMRIGGGTIGRGIHDAHLAPGVEIRYSPTDEKRQQIPRVEYRNTATGRVTVYTAADAKPDVANLPTRLMDCVDCHNRPTHTFEMPAGAVDRAMVAGAIPLLPYVKKQTVDLLQKNYRTQDDAAAAIPAALEQYYKQNYAAVYNSRHEDIRRAANTTVAIYRRNVFPNMRVAWGTYPNNIGHMDFTGCFRCHDDAHAAPDGKKIMQDCNTCHQMLAMDEPQPKILTDLGLANGVAQK